MRQFIQAIAPLLARVISMLGRPRRHSRTSAAYHLYEAVFESPRMWLKIQVSCKSQNNAKEFLGSRFGREVPSAIAPEYSLSAPFKLFERSASVANWETIKDHLPDGWDDHEFRIAEGPYPWCETLSDDCDCHGREGRLDALYCSDIGLREDAARRESKSPNVRHHAWRQMMRRYDTNVDTYDEERLKSYREAVLQMVESAQTLVGQEEPDCLYFVIRVDRKNPRGEGTLTTVQRDPMDPTGNSHRMAVSHYRDWEVCSGIIHGLMDVESR